MPRRKKPLTWKQIRRRYYLRHKARVFKRNDDYRKKLKDDAFKQYGGYVCFCCGETNPLFLTLDHKNNDGGKHRKKLGNYIYFQLRREGWPPIMQVACYNCNCGRARNGGVCPHSFSP